MTTTLERIEIPVAIAAEPPSEVAPAWDALRDPLWIVESLEWLTDAVAYLLVARANERHEPTQLPKRMRAMAGELGDMSDREQLAMHAGSMGELWQRLTKLYEHYERPFFTAPPQVRAQVVDSLNRPGLWPSSGPLNATPAADSLTGGG
jgi:hypothetical protein